MEYAQTAVNSFDALQRNIGNVFNMFSIGSMVQQIETVEDNIKKCSRGQNDFNGKLNEGSKHAGSFLEIISGIAKKVVDLADTLSRTTSHLNLMNDGLQNTEELKDKIFNAAQRSGGEYVAMSEGVAKMGIAAPDMFHSNDELIAFNEQLNKQFAISGATPEGAASVVSQITEALSSDVLGEDQMSSILKQAPSVIQTIADYMEIPVEKLGELSKEGQVAGAIIKEALFSAVDSTDARFEKLPRTLGQIWSRIQNQALLMFQPMLEKIETIANSDTFNRLTTNVMAGVGVIAEIISTIFNGVTSVGEAISGNWSIIQPIIMGIVTALGMYLGYLAIANGIELINNGIKTVSAVANLIYAQTTGTVTQKIINAAASQTKLNASFLACPITWIILGIIAIVASLYMVIEVINKVTNSNLSAMGIICGALLTAGAFIGNLFIGLFNGAIDIIGAIWEAIAAFVNFFANVFNNPVEAIARLFLDLANAILSLLKSLASAIDAIFGSKLASSVQSWKDSLGNLVEEVFGKREQPIEIFDTSSAHLERIKYRDAWNVGNSLGKSFDDKIKSFSLKGVLEKKQGYKLEDFNGLLEGLPRKNLDTSDYQNNQMSNMNMQNIPYNQCLGTGTEETLGSIADDTSSIKDSVTVTSEEITYLREIAEKEAVNRFTTAEIKVNMNNTNTISSNMDVDGITGRLEEGLYRAMSAAREGV